MTRKTGAIQAADKEDAMAHLAAIVDSSNDAILSKTPDGTITSWNQAAESLYGYSAEETVGRNIRMLVPQERLEELEQITQQVLNGDKIRNLETVRLAKGGREVQVSLTLSPILDPHGVLTGISVIARENAQQVQKERLLRESQRYYRALVEMAPDPVLVHRDGVFLYANCAALGIYGAQNLSLLQGRTFLDMVHPDDREAMRKSIDAVMAGGEPSTVEFRLLRLDGDELFIESSSTRIDYQGVPAIQVIARDISQRKASEAERENMQNQLAFQQARFEAVVEQLPVGVLIAEAPSGKVVYQNELTRVIFREADDYVAGTDESPRWKICTLDGKPLPLERYPLTRAIRQGETVFGEEYQIERGDGTRGFINVNATPLRDISGAIISGLITFNDITESRGAARALRESEERLKLALDAAEMGSCDMDVASGNGVWSRRHYLVLGYPAPQEQNGPATISMWLERIHTADRDLVLAELDRARKQRDLFCSEHRIVRADDQELVWVNVLGRFWCDDASCRFIGVIFDVTGRKAIEEELRRSVQRFRNLADSMPQIVWTANPDGRLDYLNAHFENYTGVERGILAQIMGDPDLLISDCIHPEDRQRTALAWRHSIDTGETYQIEQRITCRDDGYRWHLSRALPQRDEEGRVVKWYGTATDINDLRETQEKLRASETRFRWLYESSLVAIFFWNRDGFITDANDAYCELVGYSVEECRGGTLTLAEVTPPEEYAKDRAAMDETITRGISRTYEKVFIKQDTKERVAALTAIARMAESAAEGIGFAVDLTDLKRTEQALKQSETRLKLAIEATGLGIFDVDLQSGKGDWSPIAKQHYGLGAESPVDLAGVLQAVHPEDRDRLEQIVKDARSTDGAGLYSAEYRVIRPDGKVHWLSMRARVSYDEYGAPARLIGACLNITDAVLAQEALREEMTERVRAVEELRRQEQLLIRQGRLAAMGEMIGNIAHQWRQPLNTLGLIVQELPSYYEQGLFTKQYLESSVDRAMQVINYMSQTIDGFRNFFGPEKNKQKFLAGAILEQTLAILQAAFAAARIEFDVQADPEAEIFGSPNEYSQVLVNILMNAKDALLERKVDNPRIVIRLKREGGRTLLWIEDNAGGIPADIIEKVFDPYFTTKGPDKGTGIGLFMSKTIVEKNMKGSLSVCNTGHGARFRIEV
ncbi:PAS domain-containing sensor histidine kinase [Geomonas subterranea]|uniref:histidine kinase n=1 Tax=Geomonas subterranea TaxID=2847989 RepID=A0ABX8LNW0_9BACT|nr:MULTISPECIES: PAS domain S-box protein [Geomonas]QXE92004.1 PAS domain S-box protein [Geomonas subterranea]QXM09903.1 PAS domain S-box protein [Geomonas subterranea]